VAESTNVIVAELRAGRRLLVEKMELLDKTERHETIVVDEEADTMRCLDGDVEAMALVMEYYRHEKAMKEASLSISLKWEEFMALGQKKTSDREWLDQKTREQGDDGSLVDYI
jgi:hypothetical protein